MCGDFLCAGLVWCDGWVVLCMVRVVDGLVCLFVGVEGGAVVRGFGVWGSGGGVGGALGGGGGGATTLGWGVAVGGGGGGGGWQIGWGGGPRAEPSAGVPFLQHPPQTPPPPPLSPPPPPSPPEQGDHRDTSDRTSLSLD